MMFKELYPLVNQTQMMFNVTLGILVGIYNYLLIYQRATTYVVVETNDIEEMEEGVNEND